MSFADEQLTEQTVWSAFKYLNKNHNKRKAGFLWPPHITTAGQ